MLKTLTRLFMVILEENEKNLRYVKYFYQELAPIPQNKQIISEGAPLQNFLMMNIEEKNDFLKKEMRDDEIGFGIKDNGTGYISNKTFMPNVTVEMIDWWFAWHCIGSDLRYKLWDHDDHYYARADKMEYIINKNIPLNQKTWGVTHSILEDIGFGPTKITLSFKKPSDFGYDPSLIGEKYCNSMICAIGSGDIPAFMTHKYYKVENGTIFESKFWIGYGYINNVLTKIIPDSVKIPEIVVRNLFKHNIKEFSNLAKILPKIYEEEKNNWL